MLKVGDKVAIKFGTKGRNKIYSYGKIIGFDSNIADVIYKIESKLGENFIHDTIYTYKLRNELYKIVMICAGIF